MNDTALIKMYNGFTEEQKVKYLKEIGWYNLIYCEEEMIKAVKQLTLFDKDKL